MKGIHSGNSKQHQGIAAPHAMLSMHQGDNLDATF